MDVFLKKLMFNVLSKKKMPERFVNKLRRKKMKSFYF